MNDEWWERPVCIVCDYWWLLVIMIAIGLAGYFSRSFWLPMLNLVEPTIESTPVATPTIVGQDEVPRSQYSADQGEYSLTYPSEWPSEPVGDQAQQWFLPNGAIMSVHSEPALPGDSLAEFATEVTSRLPYDILNQDNIELGGQPAIRQEVGFPGEIKLIAIGYLFIADDQKYQIALAGLDTLSADEQEVTIQEFEEVLSSFEYENLEVGQ